MDNITRGQVSRNAAEVYDEFFLPALFEEWPDRILEAARIEPGESILDVACGTGVLALAAAERVGQNGSVVGLDINEDMLTVARRKASSVEWRHGQAENLPFLDAYFDAVVSQFGLMFFDDRQAAVREMIRVLKPDGRLAIAVWDSLENTPGYAAATGLLRRLFGDSVADGLRAPYVLGDVAVLRSLFDGFDLNEMEIKTHQGKASFPSLESWMYTDVKGWTLADVLDEAQFEILLKEAKRELRQFVGEDGKVTFRAPAHIITSYKM